jgi:hypothetical protein
MKLEFSRQSLEIYTTLNFMSIHPVEAEFFHADRRKERYDETNSRLLQFWNKPKNN